MDDPKTPVRASSETVGRFDVFEVDRHALGAGDEARQVHTLRMPDWCSVVATDEAGRLLFVRQHRHGIDAETLETVGGIVDPGEDPARAALRELREETGYAGEGIESLGWIHPNPALQDNRCHLFLVRGAVQQGPPECDHGEHTEPVVLEPADAFAAMTDGRITHALPLVALARAKERLAPAERGLEHAVAIVSEMEEAQRVKVVALARRLLPHVTDEDIRNPHDFPDLDDPDWHFEDGQLAGIESVRFALRAPPRDLVGNGTEGEAPPHEGEG